MAKAASETKKIVVIEILSSDDEKIAVEGGLVSAGSDARNVALNTPRAKRGAAPSVTKGKGKQAINAAKSIKSSVPIYLTLDTSSEDDDHSNTVRKTRVPDRRKSTVSPVKKSRQASLTPSSKAGPGPSTLRARASRGSAYLQDDPHQPNGDFEESSASAAAPVRIIPPSPANTSTIHTPAHRKPVVAKSYPDPYAAPTAPIISDKTATTEGTWLNPAVIARPSRTPSPISSPALVADTTLGSWGNPAPMQMRTTRKRSTDSTPEPVYRAKRTGGKKIKRIMSGSPPTLTGVSKGKVKGEAPAQEDMAIDREDSAGTSGQMTESSQDPLLLKDDDMAGKSDVVISSGNSIFNDAMATSPELSPLKPSLDVSPTGAKDQEAVESILSSIADVQLSPVNAPDANTAAAATSSSPSPANIPSLVLPVFDGLEYLRRRSAERRELSRQITPTLVTGSSSTASKDIKPIELDDAEQSVPSPFEIYPDMDMTREEWRKIVVEEGETSIEILLQRRQSPEPVKQLIYIDPYDAHTQSLVVEQPPPHLRGTAKRVWNSAFIDDFNHRLPTMTHNPQLHRMIFEDLIAQSELESGGISVVNEVDADPAPPDFEFECSNEILYHPDVPDPELGQGCGCSGPCSPTSKTCTCLKRQEAYSRIVQQKGFAYTADRLLRHPELPIWECGDTCGCPPECSNRVIQHGRNRKTVIQLFKTKYKGWGVRAKVGMPAGTFVGIYSGELITDIETERRGYLYDEIGRTYLFDCDGYHITSPPDGLEEFDERLAETAAATAERARLAKADNADDDNYVYSGFSVDAFHYGYTRFFNHSCDPNLCIAPAYVKDYHPERPLLVVFTRREIRSGEELCISYKGIVAEEEEIEQEKPKKSNKKKKGKMSKVTAKAHVTPAESLVSKKLVKDVCRCDAPNCNGTMFN